MEVSSIYHSDFRVIFLSLTLILLLVNAEHLRSWTNKPVNQMVFLKVYFTLILVQVRVGIV